MCEAQAALDRICDTPIPFAYAVHTHQFLLLYLSTLPFTMVITYQYYALVAVFIISFGMLGIDEAGVEIEDPFGLDDNDLPLDKICANIAKQAEAIAKFGQGNSPAISGESSKSATLRVSVSEAALLQEEDQKNSS